MKLNSPVVGTHLVLPPLRETRRRDRGLRGRHAGGGLRVGRNGCFLANRNIHAKAPLPHSRLDRLFQKFQRRASRLRGHQPARGAPAAEPAPATALRPRHARWAASSDGTAAGIVEARALARAACLAASLRIPPARRSGVVHRVESPLTSPIARWRSRRRTTRCWRRNHHRAESLPVAPALTPPAPAMATSSGGTARTSWQGRGRRRGRRHPSSGVCPLAG